MKSRLLWITVLGLIFTVPVFSQSLAGTTWNITVPEISSRPFNFIFGITGNKGNVLLPDGTLTDFTWTEDASGNWAIIIQQMVQGIPQIYQLSGNCSGNKGSGFYTFPADSRPSLPLTMTKK